MRDHQHMVFTTAARLLGNDRQAEDIAQEAFLKAYEHFDHLRTNPAAGGWLRTVTRNLTFNYLGRHRRRWRLFTDMRADDISDPGMDIPAPDDLFTDINTGMRHALIEQALARLPDHQRLPLVLYHFEDMSYEEIASQLHISMAKLKVDLFRARAALAKTLLHKGVTAETELTS